MRTGHRYGLRSFPLSCDATAQVPDARMIENAVIVVIPLYTTQLAESDRLSLERTIALLGHHPVAIVCPDGLDLSPLDSVLRPASPRIERFAPACFEGIEGYNRMMLSPDFYARFTGFEFLLLCQTDVFVFEDRLTFWCGKGYDYVGAPWIGSPRTVFNRLLFQVRNAVKRRKRSEEHLFKVGNGGFSLRRVATMLRIVEEQRADIEHALKHPNRHRHHIEDVYISLLAPLKLPGMKIPGYEEAIDFCIDRKPEIALEINGGQLPFACHGFNKPKVRRFWEGVIAHTS